MMKKICIITKNMMGGGAERVISHLINYMVRNEYEVCLILYDNRPIHYKIPIECTVKIIGKTSHNKITDKILRYKNIRKITIQEKPDVVLSMPEEIGIFVICALLGTKIPVIVSERNNPWVMPNKKITRILRRLVYPFAKGLIFQTDNAASFFTKSQQKKGIVLKNPLDCSRLPDMFCDEHEKIIVGAGRLENQKNFSLLIQAFSLFHKMHTDYKLIIYGEGENRKELEQLASNMLPLGSWSFPGKVNDLPEKINRCEIFVLSSDFEGVPNVLIEAMAVGTPCIATDCAPGGAASLIKDKENGLLVPTNDIQALADAMCFMIDNPLLAENMAKNAIKIREELNVEKVAAEWIAYLEKCTK